VPLVDRSLAGKQAKLAWQNAFALALESRTRPNPETPFAPRFALAGDLLLSGATEEGKSALYKRDVSRGEFLGRRRSAENRRSTATQEKL